MSNIPHERPTEGRFPDDAARGTGQAPGAAPGPAGPGGARSHEGPGAPRSGAAPRSAAPDTTDPAAVPDQPAGTPPRSQQSVAEGRGTGSPAVDPALDSPAKRGVSGTVWAALILGVIVLILLLVFIVQNNVDTGFEYMAWSFSLPLGVAMLLSAIAGALIMALVGSVRMFALSHRVRRLERERERIKDTLGA